MWQEEKTKIRLIKCPRKAHLMPFHISNSISCYTEHHTRPITWRAFFQDFCFSFVIVRWTIWYPFVFPLQINLSACTSQYLSHCILLYALISNRSRSISDSGSCNQGSSQDRFLNIVSQTIRVWLLRWEIYLNHGSHLE